MSSCLDPLCSQYSISPARSPSVLLFKMVETRRYSQLELSYVLSRVLAKWKPEIIAKAFKRDHAPYWDDKVFTKKQVSYIKSTYKGPPG